MPKKINKIQKAGLDGESEFELWATKFGWYPVKPKPDVGIDYICQVEGRKISANLVEMPGKCLSVSVRSTTEESDVVTIDRNDAELFFSANPPLVLAIVKRAPLGEAGKVAIKFPDEDFIIKLLAFLKSTNETLKVRFSEALSDKKAIREKTNEVLLGSQPWDVKRREIENLFQDVVDEPQVEILFTAHERKAYVRHQTSSTQTNYLINDDLGKYLKDSGIHKVELIHASSTLNLNRDSATQESFGFVIPAMFSEEIGNISVITNDIQELIDLINDELLVWNYDKAFSLAEIVESKIQIGEIASAPNMLFLLARVNTIHAELRTESAPNYIEQANRILQQIETLPAGRISADLKNDVVALKGSIINIQEGPAEALEFLGDNLDPYSIRMRIAMLITQKKYQESVDIIKDFPANERWCDLATKAYVLNNDLEKARDLFKWAASQKRREKFVQCIAQYSSAILTKIYCECGNEVSVRPNDLTNKAKVDIAEVVKILRSVMAPVIVSGEINNALDLNVFQMAWQASYLLGDVDSVKELASLISTFSPIPVDIARYVISGIISPPPNLATRLKDEHPGDIIAHILSAVIQAQTGDPLTAYKNSKTFIPLADTDEKKEELVKFFMQVRQGLKEDAKECGEVALSLAEHNQNLSLAIRADIALGDDDPDKALELLLSGKNEDDIYWLQLIANAHIKKKEWAAALDYLLISAEKTSSEMIFLQAADIAMEAQNIQVSISCCEKVLEIDPNNIHANSNLASIYTFNLHDIGKGNKYWEILHSLDPENPVYGVNLAYCLGQLYRVQESIDVYDELCSRSEPELRAVIGRAEILNGSQGAEKAFSSLNDFRDLFWNSPDFLLQYMNIAYASGEEELAHEAMQAMVGISAKGDVDPKTFKMVSAEDSIEMIKQDVEASQKRDAHLYGEMLKGKMPWVWLEQVSGKAIYHGWFNRTQELKWLSEVPETRAAYSIYSTNSFHPHELPDGRLEVQAICCPPRGATIVGDISALITLHRLELLNETAEYFGEIIIPESYLSTVLLDSKKLAFHQKSKLEAAKKIFAMSERGEIKLIPSEEEREIAFVDEYDSENDPCHRMMDIIKPAFDGGYICDAEYERMQKIYGGKAAKSKKRKKLILFQDVSIEPTTLESIHQLGLLEPITSCFQIFITTDYRNELWQRIEWGRRQEEIRELHLNLWSFIRDDKRFKIVAHDMEGLVGSEEHLKDFLPFLALSTAKKLEIPLLVDDRACQAMLLNERRKEGCSAFGSDIVISVLKENKIIDLSKAANSLLLLFKWRYRFLLPTVDILKLFASKCRHTPPGKELNDVARYVHECMRDKGLFAGQEATDSKESMAARLYVSWVAIVSQFLVEIWGDGQFTKESAEKITKWGVNELIPSPPSVMNPNVRSYFSNATTKATLMHAMLKTNEFPDNDRIPDALKAIKEALAVDDEEYLKIVVEILNDTRKTDLQ